MPFAAHLEGLSDISATVNEHAMHHLEHFWLFQNELWHPHPVGNVPHASQCKQVALCTQDGLSSGQPLHEALPNCKNEASCMK